MLQHLTPKIKGGYLDEDLSFPLQSALSLALSTTGP